MPDTQEAAAPGLDPASQLLPESTALCRLPERAVPRTPWALAWASGPVPLQKLSSQPPLALLPQSYTPTVFERLTVNLQMKGKPVNLQIWDTAGGCAKLGEGPQMPESVPHSLPSETGRPTDLQGTGLGPPGTPTLLASAPVCCLPHPRAAHGVLETRGSPEFFALEG